jgi:DNA-binding Lrp family transcriptional regulator
MLSNGDRKPSGVPLTMDEKDRLLLTCLQSGLPLTPRPFDIWASKTGMDGAELLVRMQRLKREGIFGGIQAILDPKTFRYQSAWGAMRFSPERLESGAEILGRHPGVLYSCERRHSLNVWFFIALPQEQNLELHIRCMEKISGAEQSLFLPVRRILKGTSLLGVIAPEISPGMPEFFESCSQKRSVDLKAEEIQVIRQLQEPFPLTDEPFRKIARDLGITEMQALDRMKALVEKKCLRPIGSSSKPALIEPSPNAMVVWQIPEEKIERIAPEIPELDKVIYADQREAFPEFPFSLYTMVRDRSASELELAIRRMQDRFGKWPHQELVTVREFKKERMRYFPKELDAWWQENRQAAETAFH